MPRETIKSQVERVVAVTEAAWTLASVAHANRIVYREAILLLRACMQRLAREERAAKRRAR